jgi:hypothetical protein
MASTNPSSIQEMAFAPRGLITIQVGCYLATVYPKVEFSMLIYEHAHAF